MFFDIQLLKKCLFIDIETVPQEINFDALDDDMKSLWEIKCQQFMRGDSPTLSPNEYYISKAGIFAEFGKVVCISMGFLYYENGIPTKIRIKSLSNQDEKEILTKFSKLLEEHYSDIETSKLCGHNIKEFDIPYLCRRMVVHGVSFPELLDISGKKPWQTTHILDTMDLWRFGDYKHYTSLKLLSKIFGIPSPKDDIDGSQVGHTYWVDQDIERIVRYCEKDVITVIRIMLKYSAGQPMIEDSFIDFL